MPHGLESFETKMTARQSAKVGFDPASIIMIIQAILALFGGCAKPTLGQVRRARRARVAAAIRRETGMTWPECFDQADDALATANEASDAELQEFIDDCCS